ncbi:restriction endonuclease subunit S [Sulfitobacter dubius]|uniref:Type I restriction modification DNA specificity domain-containing protein n=1 Tax=Sulfitobacter dubius TaxID=218673 RepID=A0ABY3ZK66_9RHOB|nr:restriction endonuclease subunit S [Sulfitobacter dubius]UOA14986.1 hypothetical protein DSM109990_01805 [Sulfitobacter dubius]
MSGWQTYATSKLIADGILEIGDGYRAKNSEMGPDGLPFVRAGDVDGRVNTNGVDLLSYENAAKVGRKRSMPGDVIMTTKGTIGRLAYVTEGDVEFVYSPQLCFWRSLDRNVIEPRWLFYGMRSAEMETQISWSAGQTDMAPYVSLTDQRNAFNLTLPPLPEQREIAAILGALDDKIEVNRKASATLEEMARALYRSWFVDFDPVHARAQGRPPAHMAPETAALFPDSFGDDGLPLGWSFGTLADLIEFNPRERITKGTIAPYFDMRALPTSGLNTDAPIQREFSSGTKFRAMDTLLARITPCLENGKTAMVPELGDQEIAWGSTEFIVMRARPDVPVSLPYCVARDPAFRDEAIATMTGSSGRQRADAMRISEMPIAIPIPEIISEFGIASVPLIDRIHQFNKEIKTLAALRDALLPRLMSGELRVGAARAQIEDVA